MSSRKKKKSWAKVRSNVEYLGCYGDYAHKYPEYRDPKYYYVPPSLGKLESGKIVKTRKGNTPIVSNDPRLPPARKYFNYLDGQPRLMQSLEKITSTIDNPTNLSLDQALRRCYDMSRLQNKRYFALQNGGFCMASDTKEFAQLGKLADKECKSTGKGEKGGGYFTNSVFEIKDMNFDNEEEEEPALKHDPFAPYRYPEPIVGDEMDCKVQANKFFDLSPTQMFMQQYFNENHPLKGMLSFKSAGSGKTCEALNVIGNFMGKWRIFWVTRTSLRDTPLKNLYQDMCQTRLREIIDSPEPITLASGEVLARTKDEKIAFIRSDRAPAILKRYGIEIEKQRIISYDNFVRMIAGKDSLSRKLLDQQLELNANDMGYETLFVFDEAHNLISNGLPEDERKELDAEFSNVTIGDKTFSTLRDVYGSLNGINPDAPIKGRDLIAAMFFQSFRISKKKSAKMLILTGTPMSTSPVEMFWLMNLMLDNPKQRLSLDINDYYDTFSMKLKDEAVIRFATAAHGRISFLDTTQNPTNFAKKIFAERMNSALHKFHQRIIDETVEKEKAKTENVDWTKLVSIYQNLSLVAKTRGSFFDEETIAEYESEMKRMKNWKPEQEREHQTKLYLENVGKARAIFKMEIKESDRKSYEKKVEQYNKWATKNQIHPPEKLQDALDSNGDLLSFEEWARKEEKQQGQNEVLTIPKDVKKRYEALKKKKEDYDEKLKKGGKKPRRPKIEEILKTDGTLKTENEFFLGDMVTKISRRDQSEYNKLKEDFLLFKSDLVTYEQKSKQSASEKRAKLPERSAIVDQVMGDYGQLLTLEEWYAKELEPKRAKKEKKKYTKEQVKYVKYLIRDPASGLMRIRSLQEFVQVRDPSPTLDGEERRKGISLSMWHKNFSSDAYRQLMPYYAPKLHDCIENIVSLEKEAMDKYGHGFKHTVFTFSVAGKGGDSSAYGSRAVASAFYARSDLFRILLVYKESEEPDENGEFKFVLRDDIPNNGPNDKRWGVCILSSKNIPNIYLDEYGGNQTVEYNFKIVRATQAAFNASLNKYGDRIKIMIMDGAYTEGVEAFDDSIGHYLNESLSKSQLEQASARSVRFCRSKNIPFFKNVGGFMEMYFYSQSDLYEQMMAHVPYEQQLNLNLMDVFRDLASQFSIDYWLNINVNDFKPVQQGVLTDYYKQWNRSYIVTKELQLDKKTEVYDFVVDPESMVTRIQNGSTVTDAQGREGTVLDWEPSTRKFRVQFSEGVDSMDARTLRLAPGQLVDFYIPYGVDLSQKVMNIGNYNVMHPADMVSDMVQDIRLPENALRVVSTGFRNNVTFILLGIVSLLRMILKSGGAGVDVNIVLPPSDEGESIPALSNFSMQWILSDSGERVTAYSYLPMREFLAPKTGLSFMFLSLHQAGKTSGGEDDTHLNLLLYIPEWGTIERFDPMGYSAHTYDSVALDARLYDVFQKLNPELRYMSSAETNPLHGVQRLQMKEKERDSASYMTIFALLYMHMRILYAADHLKMYPREKREVFPLQFQRGLIDALSHKLKLTEYIRNYAELAVQSKDFVFEWKNYSQELPFWSNSAKLAREMMRLVAKKSSVGAVDNLTSDNPKKELRKPDEKKKEAVGFFQRLKDLTSFII